MRGVPGNFDKALESARCCAKAQASVSGLRLIVNINTVDTRDNSTRSYRWRDDSVRGQLVDGHYFNLIRGDANDPG